MKTAYWFRCDLRIEDNPALEAAYLDGANIALFVISPQQWALHNDAACKLLFWREALRDLTAKLEQRGMAMRFLYVPHWRDLAPKLLDFCQSLGVTSVHCNREHGVNERRRDREIFQLFQKHGCSLIGHDGQTLLAPGSVKTGAGDFYRVFTPFAKVVIQRIEVGGVHAQPAAPARETFDRIESDNIDEHWPKLPLSESMEASIIAQWPADYKSAMARLDRFTQHSVEQYHKRRDFPCVDGTSALSPYLSAGVISVRQCLDAARQVNGGEVSSGNLGVVSWINELLWREFYRHLMYGFPQLSMHRPLRVQTDGVIWRSNEQDFEAWCQAQTGIPIVDAAMTQLLSTGWMHNRLRMIVAMFLSKNLLIDWRKGETFFMKHLIDGDLASNNGGWQWSASTGADASPYFRVFNPISQSKKFDPKGDFLRQWLPRLSPLDERSIHEPSHDQCAALGYPRPIVDLKSSRARAIDTFKSL